MCCINITMYTILVNAADFDDDSDVEVDKDMHERSQLECTNENEGYKNQELTFVE